MSGHVKVALAMRPGLPRKEVYADVEGGLAIHPDADSGTAWDITHVRSGYRVADRYDTEEEARAMRAKLLLLLDWETLATFADAHALPRERMEAIAAAIGGELLPSEPGERHPQTGEPISWRIRL